MRQDQAARANGNGDMFSNACMRPYSLTGDARLEFLLRLKCKWSARASIVGLQPTVIASRAPHLLLEQSVMTIQDSKNRGRASPVKGQ